MHGLDQRASVHETLISSLDLGRAVLLLVEASCLSHRLMKHATTQAGSAELDVLQVARRLADEVELEAALIRLESFPLIPAAQRARLHEAGLQWSRSRRASRHAARGEAAALTGEQLYEVLEALMTHYLAVMNTLRKA